MSWRRDQANSVYDFERLVVPELEPYLGGKIQLVERQREKVADALDIYAGFDALCHTPDGIHGLANRVQWADDRKPVEFRDCPKCGETTSSASGYYCAGCHFRGWWGRWA